MPKKASSTLKGKVKKPTKAKAVEAEVIHDEPSGGALTTTDPLSLYLAEVRKYPLLTKEEEHELAVKYYETGDPKAAEKLVTSNLRFVISIAAEYSKFGAKMIDLAQEGNIGLMHAVKEFNPYQGVRLITYAVWWIRGYIREFLLRQHSMVRIGTTAEQKKLFYQLNKEQQKMEAMGQDVNVALLSSRLGVEEKAVRDMQQRLSKKDLSLDQPIDSENQNRLVDLQMDGQHIGVDDALGAHQDTLILQEKIDEIRSKLNEKELYILEHRLLSDEPKTLQEIGDHFKITRERTRQIEAHILQLLKKEYAND